MNRTNERSLGLLAILVAVALLTAACDGGSSAGGSGGARAAARPASPPSGAGASSAASSPVGQRKQLAYSECMREHGVPDVPTALPSIVPDGVPSSNGPHWNAAAVGGPSPGSPQWLAAQQACRSVMPKPALVPG
jgi:hypothetical protein